MAAIVFLPAAGRSEVRLSEFMAAPSDRLLAADGHGRRRPGTGPHWTDPGFVAPGWRRGTAPLGFGGAAGLGTNVSALMNKRTPALYLRRLFTATAADLANPGSLQLTLAFNDGFVAHLNGREVGRANAGPAGHHLYHDQPAYNFAASSSDFRYQPSDQPGVGGPQPLTLSLGPAGPWLREGENVLAVQLLNREPDAVARLDAALEIRPAAVPGDPPDPAPARTLVPWSASDWDYWPGLAEPSGGVVESADFDSPGAETGFSDWIELENTGPEPVGLTGWSLTDRRDQPRRWPFPAGVTLAPGGRLVVLASSRAEAPPGAVWLHANFSLAEEGGYLALVDAGGTVRDSLDPGYGRQGPFHSQGRNDAGAWGFLREASPGAPNRGPWFSGEAEPVRFSPPGGFHAGPVTLVLSTPTPEATIYYTTDGTEPTTTQGLAWAGPVVLAPIDDKTGHAVRARAFRDGLVPSPTTTQTYLIDQHPNLRTTPAVVLTGDPGTVFYRPLGIFAIEGGTYSSDLWIPQKAADYNIPMGSGRLVDPLAPQRPYERPAHLEFFPIDGRPALGAAVGLRVASSPYSRPQLRLTQVATASPLPADETEKSSLNIFFRREYGASSVTHPFIPETPVWRFEELRLRAGKNDLSNPFIRDEFIRRLFADMGHTASLGSFNALWINGSYKGYYNLCERVREPFLQNHHPGSGEWDVNYIGEFEDGDRLHFDSALIPRLAADLSIRAQYEALAGVLDLVNAADYYLLMVYAAMWDWPDNNWVMARERSPSGRWRCYPWDAEGAFGLHQNKPASWNTLIRDLFGRTDWLGFQFQRLMTSPAWRLHFADRIQRYFFNGGVLSDARLIARKNETAAEVQPLLAHAGLIPDDSWFTNWLDPASGRKRVLFPHHLPGEAGYGAGHFRDPNGDGSLADTLWPLTLAPTLSLAPGAVPPGSPLTLGLAPGVPEGSTIWHTINGADPRAGDGTPDGGAAAFVEPIPITASSVTVRARVRHAVTAEWSPLTEASYHAGTVAASAATLVISELMYHPPAPTAAEAAAGFTDADAFEYISLRNIGDAPLDLSGLRFSAGISFDFADAARIVLDPADQVLLARSRAAMAHRYGASVAARVVGEFFGGLSNGGEALRLENKADGAAVKAFAYADRAPWPAADGTGPSLLLRQPTTNPDHGSATNWTASAALGGQPGGSALPLTYAEWGVWAFSPAQWAEPGLSSPEADADGDGWTNLLEFLLGGSPLDPLRTPSVAWNWRTGGDSSRLEVSVLSYPGAAGVVITPEGSDSLSGGTWLGDFTSVAETPQADGSVRRTWSRSVPARAKAFFGRLRVAPVP